MRTAAFAGVMFGLVMSGASPAAPFVIPLDGASSNITVTLCIQNTCGNDTAPAEGFFLIDVNAVGQITSASIYDFNMAVTRPLTLNVNFGALGHFFSTATNFSIFDGNPGVQMGPVAGSGTTYSFSPVTTLETGLLNYSATGVVCANLQQQQIPCNGTIDFATYPPTYSEGGAGPCPGAPIVCDITSVGRDVTLVANICQQGYIDPFNPANGAITITGTVSGTSTIPVPPCPADLNGDHIVNTADLTGLLGHFGQNVAPGTNGDLNGDGVVNTQDLTGLLGAFGSACADH